MALDELRRPLLICALLCAMLIVVVEVGSLLPHFASAGNAVVTPASSRPGYAIPYLAAVDVLLLYSLLLMAVSLLLSREWTGRLQGVVGVVVALVLLLALVVMLFSAIELAVLMLTLLTTVPFGTIAYVALFGHFERGAASAALSLILLGKVVLAACLILAQPRFLKNRSLVALSLISFGCTLMIALLHGLPPIVFVSITDIIAAIVVAAIALLLGLWLLLGSIIATVKAV